MLHQGPNHLDALDSPSSPLPLSAGAWMSHSDHQQLISLGEKDANNSQDEVVAKNHAYIESTHPCPGQQMALEMWTSN